MVTPPEDGLGNQQVQGGGDLDVFPAAGGQVDLLAQALHGGAVVGKLHAGVDGGLKGGLQKAGLHDLGSLHREEGGAVRRGQDAAVGGVCGFDGVWPYNVPVFVLSRTLETIPEEYKEKAELVKGSLTEILEQSHNNGYHRLYIDGGVTIQNFLKEDLIDELTITVIPILLGGGSPLFSQFSAALEFNLLESKVFLNQLVQSHYKRKR